MNEFKFFEYSDDIDINSIFERKIELGAVIQFNLLQRILEEFIKRQKAMNDKISLLQTKIKIMANQKSSGKDLDLLLKKTEDEFEMEFDETFNKSKEIEVKKNKGNEIIKNKETEGNKNKENLDKEIKNKKKENKENKEIIEEKKEKKVNEEIDDNNLNKNINSKVEKLESLLKEMTNFIKKTNNDFNEFKTEISQVNKANENKINELSRKLNYLNDIEILKIDNKPNENEDSQDKAKEIVNPLSQNLSERIENLEKRVKKNDDNIYSLKKDIVTIKNLNDNIYKLAHSNQENIINISKDLETKSNALNRKIDEEVKKLKENCDTNYKENRYEIIKYYNELKDKLSNLMNEINKNKNNKNINSLALGNEKLNDVSNELKNYINKSLADTERYLKSIIANLKIDKIKSDLIGIHEEIDQNKLLKKEIELINGKITNTIEKKIIELFQKLDAISTDINLCNDTCSKTVKMVEYLSGQMIQTYQPDLENNYKDKVNTVNYHNLKQDIDMTSYMTKELFKEEKNKILKKIEKTFEIEGENYLFIQKMEERLKFFVSENDLKNMENSFISLIEELKIFFNKKFLDKNELQKSLKSIEMQLRQIIETGALNNRDSENWLLAKKPMNNYVCASCETYLGELKNKSVFLPWNRIPSREEKKYRMGQGFSKMLQMMNMDILKNAEMVNPDLSIKYNDEKKIDEYKRLPKIKSQINMFNQNKAYSIMPSNNSVDHVEYGLNNSADNVEQIEDKKVNDGKNFSSSYYSKTIDKDNKLENNNIQMKTNYKNFYSKKNAENQTLNSQEPKVVRIVKLKK